MITTAQALAKYGQPNETGTYLTTIKLPYPMRIAWDTKTMVTKMRCHKLVADAFLNVFNELLEKKFRKKGNPFVFFGYYIK